VGYRLSRRARDDLVAIYVASAEAFGVAQAERYHAEIERAFDYLAPFPRVARERHEIDPPVRIHPHKSHLIVYAIIEADILILRVRHGHEGWSTP
jgi:toxin ParE1/3/4